MPKTGSRKTTRAATTQGPVLQRLLLQAPHLCALGLEEPCPTFRPDTPRGLVPPVQPVAPAARARDSRASSPRAQLQPARRAGTKVPPWGSDEDRRKSVRLTVLGQVALVAGRRGGLQRLPDPGGRRRVLLDCGNGVFGKLREQIDYVDLDAVDHHPPARRPLPRPRPLLLRAHLCAEAAAGPGAHLAGNRHPGPPAADRAARGDRDLPPRGRRLGQRRPDRERLRARGVRPGRHGRGRSDRAPASTRSRTSSTPSRSTSAPTARQAHLRRRSVPARS